MPIYVNLFFCYAGAPEVLEFKTVYIIVSPFGGFLNTRKNETLTIISFFFQGAYASIAIIVKPFGAFISRYFRATYTGISCTQSL